MKGSRIISLRRICKLVSSLSHTLRRNKINVYAAESAFYIILSAIPFLMLIVTAARYIIPDGARDYMEWFADHIPGVLGEYIKTEFLTFADRPTPTPLSLSAFGTLWGASRGVKAVRRGLRSVFDEDSGSFISETVRGLFFTIVFIFLIVAVLVFLVFGDVISGLLGSVVPSLYALFDLIILLSPAFFALLLYLFFAFLYRTMTPAEAGMTKYRDHSPGAMLAAVGWILYSYLFSLFIDKFSNMSYIYGSLTAIMILMLWVYMIMYILLLGALWNKHLYFRVRSGEKVKM